MTDDPFPTLPPTNLKYQGLYLNPGTLTERDIVWETRVPGVDGEQTWDTGDHEHVTLLKALEAVFPFYREYDLTTEQAAHLCLRLGLIMGTGITVDELMEGIKETDDPEGK